MISAAKFLLLTIGAQIVSSMPSKTDYSKEPALETYNLEYAKYTFTAGSPVPAIPIGTRGKTVFMGAAALSYPAYSQKIDNIHLSHYAGKNDMIKGARESKYVSTSSIRRLENHFSSWFCTGPNV